MQHADLYSEEERDMFNAIEDSLAAVEAMLRERGDDQTAWLLSQNMDFIAKTLFDYYQDTKDDYEPDDYPWDDEPYTPFKENSYGY